MSFDDIDIDTWGRGGQTTASGGQPTIPEQQEEDERKPRKQRKAVDLPTRDDVSDLCDLAARVYHTDAPYKQHGKIHPPNRGQVYKLVTRVRTKLGGLP